MSYGLDTPLNQIATPELPRTQRNELVKREPELAQKIDGLSRAMDTLDQTIASVFERVRPVSAPRPQKDMPSATSPAATQVGGLLQTNIDRLGEFNRRLLEMLDSLEV